MKFKVHNRVFEINKASLLDLEELKGIAERTFIQSHGHSAAQDDIDHYIRRSFDLKSIQAELTSPWNLYYILISDGGIIGYSKIQMDISIPSHGLDRTCKLDRIYVLEDFHGKGLGKKLLEFGSKDTLYVAVSALLEASNEKLA